MKSALLIIGFSAALAAQVVDGDVFDALKGSPLPGVVVSSTNGVNQVAVKSDASGHFRIAMAPANGLGLQFTRPGYLRFSKNIIGRAPTSGPIHVEMTPEAVISGKLEDEDGFPVERAYVEALLYQTNNGERSLRTVASGQSNDRGEYRLDNLAAGRYYLRIYAGEAQNWDKRYVSQYLGGGVQFEEAKAVEVKAGEIRAETQIRLVKFEGVTVSGRLVGLPADATRMGIGVMLETKPQSVGALFVSTVRAAGGDTLFSIKHVPPGNYTLRYRSGNGEPMPGDLLAEQAVQVGDRDIRDLTLTPHTVQPLDIEGQVVLPEGGDLGLWLIGLRSNRGNLESAHANPDGTFVLKGLMPGHYDLQIMPDYRAMATRANPKTPPRIVSAKLGEVEVLKTGFDVSGPAPGPLRITASAKYANVTGTLLDPNGSPLAEQRLLFLSDTQVPVSTTLTDDKGHFQAIIPAEGSFRVYVLEGDQFDEESLKAHATDFPLVRAVFGDNAPVTLVWRVKK